MARKRISAKQRASLEAREGLAMARAQLASMEAGCKAMKLILRDLEKKVANQARLEELGNAATDPE
jgi:hypothetical protein